MRCDSAAAGPIVRVYPPFQSLSGFLMRCDGRVPRRPGERSSVSIPIGFSDAL